MSRADELEGMLRQATRPSAARVAKKWKDLPKGWTQESVRKFWDSLTDRAPKHPVSRCIREMDGKVSNPGAFCGGLADQMIPGWREEAAKERKDKKACGDGPCQCGGSCGCGGKPKAQPLSLQPDYGESNAALPRAARVIEGWQTREASLKWWATPPSRIMDFGGGTIQGGARKFSGSQWISSPEAAFAKLDWALGKGGADILKAGQETLKAVKGLGLEVELIKPPTRTWEDKPYKMRKSLSERDGNNFVGGSVEVSFASYPSPQIHIEFNYKFEAARDGVIRLIDPTYMHKVLWKVATDFIRKEAPKYFEGGAKVGAGAVDLKTLLRKVVGRKRITKGANDVLSVKGDFAKALGRALEGLGFEVFDRKFTNTATIRRYTNGHQHIEVAYLSYDDQTEIAPSPDIPR